MKPRQFIADDAGSDEPVMGRDVVVEDDEPQFTGLYDAGGRKLYRVSEKVKIGFHR